MHEATREFGRLMAMIEELVSEELLEGEDVLSYLGRVESAPIPDELVATLTETMTRMILESEDARDTRATLAMRSLRGEDLFPR